MSASRDREKKRAGRIARPKITNSELAQKVNEFCQLLRQRNKELRELLQQQRRVLLQRLPVGRIQ